MKKEERKVVETQQASKGIITIPVFDKTDKKPTPTTTTIPITYITNEDGSKENQQKIKDQYIGFTLKGNDGQIVFELNSKFTLQHNEDIELLRTSINNELDLIHDYLAFKET